MTMNEEHEYNTSSETTETPVPPVETEEKEKTTIKNITPSGQRLISYFERLDRLEEQKQDLSDDTKEVYAEAKNDGFDVKAMRKIASMRKKDPQKLAEENETIDMYLASMGWDHLK